jgi:circadian clock protein KaiC
MADRCDTGIVELDTAMAGGIPKGNLVLLSGGAGTGKSTFCLHFLISGAKKGERGIYISTEQNQAELIKQADCYSLPLKEFIDSGSIKVVMIDVLKDDTVVDKLRKEVSDFSPSRLVIDSLSTFSEFASTIDFARDLLLRRGGVATRTVDQVPPQRLSERTFTKRMLGMLISTIQSMNVTAVLTSELPEKAESLSSDGISEFLCDGVILLYFFGVGESEFRNLQIRKMRYTNHERKAISYNLTSTGIKVMSDEEVLKL